MAAASAGQALPPITTESWVSARPHTHARYHVLHNVLLRDSSLLFFVPDDKADVAPDEAHSAPTAEELRVPGVFWDDAMEHFKVVVVSKNNRSEHLDSCTHWVEQPAVMFHGAGGDTVNYFHFWADSFSHVFNTIAELGYFDMGAFLARNEEPTRAQANLVLIERRPASWYNIFGLHRLYDYITPDLWTFPRGAGSCYKTLAIGLDTHLTMYLDSSNEEDLKKKVASTAHMVRFTEAAQKRIDAASGMDLDAMHQAQTRSPAQPVISLISRPGGRWNSRSIRNEDELMEAMQKRFSSAIVQKLYFNGSTTLSENILAVKHTDVLVGAHGAGMTNALWLREGSSVLQLIPYGWRNKSGFVLGEDIFRRLAEHKRCAYFMWENRHANMSWLNHGQGGEEHPDPSVAESYSQFRIPESAVHGPWHYQDTTVELDSFLEVLAHAVSAVELVQAADS